MESRKLSESQKKCYKYIKYLFKQPAIGGLFFYRVIIIFKRKISLIGELNGQKKI